MECAYYYKLLMVAIVFLKSISCLKEITRRSKGNMRLTETCPEMRPVCAPLMMTMNITVVTTLSQ